MQLAERPIHIIANPTSQRGNGALAAELSSLLVQERAGRQEPFRAREMKEMLRGFYVSSFYLFYGEQLHYFITDDAQEKNITESGTISRDLRISTEGTDRFGILDSLTALAAAGRREEALEGLSRYRLQRALTEELFGKSAAGTGAPPAAQHKTGETGR